MLGEDLSVGLGEWQVSSMPSIWKYHEPHLTSFPSWIFWRVSNGSRQLEWSWRPPPKVCVTESSPELVLVWQTFFRSTSVPVPATPLPLPGAYHSYTHSTPGYLHPAGSSRCCRLLLLLLQDVQQL